LPTERYLSVFGSVPRIGLETSEGEAVVVASALPSASSTNPQADAFLSDISEHSPTPAFLLLCDQRIPERADPRRPPSSHTKVGAFRTIVRVLSITVR
jgi:hypothetical protein